MTEQLPLFASSTEEPVASTPGTPALTAAAPLHTAMRAFGEHMLRVEMTQNTYRSFLGDLSLLERYLGRDTQIGAIGTKDLHTFMDYLRHGRGVPCTAKSYSRRLTTLKVFFGWLSATGVLSGDPAATLVHEPAASPLPAILFDAQVQQALDAARTLAADPQHPDPRPILLLSLVLQTGMKKSECLALQMGHFDLSDPAAPAVYIRYKEPKRRHKERKIALERSFPALLQGYLQVYRPQLAIFPCTGRNLEYVLKRVAQLAGLAQGISFETLRWTCALRDLRSGMEPEHLRRKLGLSQIAWEETLPKIQALAAKPL